MIHHGLSPLRSALRRTTGKGKCIHQQATSRLSHTTPFIFNIPSPTASIASSRCLSSKRKAPTSYARALSPLFALGLLIGGSGYYLLVPSPKSKTLNSSTFVPYKITAREAISPTSFVFTITPQHPNPSLPYLLPDSPLWRHNLWSVEFKQPEVQIARHYTPLPPLDGEDTRNGRLRFYVRSVGGGEMSHYLGRLREGKDIWLRGPHAGFDVVQRLGSRKQVVFLAGGTGVVPGMQVAKAVLDGSEATQVSLLWAIRKREELQSAQPATSSWWQFWTTSGPTELDVTLEQPSPIARQLREMKAKYGDRLKIQVAIDEERTQFRGKDIQGAMIPSNQRLSTDAPSSQGCVFHDQRMHELISESGPADASCKCALPNGQLAGKNLLMVSGPDGFISHYAGDKVWLGGHHTQGPIGGVAAQLQRQRPGLANDWLVLKL